MKAGYGCKIFGAHQAFMGIKDAAVLLHSVVGCNFSSMGMHFTACDMTDVRQTCTVISDSDVVFGGERSLRMALENMAELYRPPLIIVLTGCVSDIVQDDAESVCKEFEKSSGIKTLFMEAAGYRGSLEDGYENALRLLGREMEDKKPGRSEVPKINILGLGADDFRSRFDIREIKRLLEPKVEIGCIFGDCSFDEVKKCSDADLNIVIGRGFKLAEYMKERFGIPFGEVDFPYGLTGIRAIWDLLSKHFGLDYSSEEKGFREYTAEELKRSYSYIQSLYGLPVAVIGSRARAKGLSRFLSSELGMEVEVCAFREEHRDMDDVYEKIRSSDSAMVFASSFEKDISLELSIAHLAYDFPVFDRITLSDRPYAGAKGTLCLIEDILNVITQSRSVERPLYR